MFEQIRIKFEKYSIYSFFLPAASNDKTEKPCMYIIKDGFPARGLKLRDFLSLMTRPA